MRTTPAIVGDVLRWVTWGAVRVAGVGTILCFIAVSIYLLWTLDRGFTLTDEAYYLLLAMQPEATSLYISAQQWITAGLWQVSGSITAFRAAGMLILLFSAYVLAIGVFSAGVDLGLIEERRGSKAVLIAGAAVGAMLYASTINLSPGYNLLASAGAYAAAGLVLLASNRSSLSRKCLLYVLAGSALAVEALCKASAGASTFALLLLWLLIFERGYKHRVMSALAMAFGLVTFSFLALFSNTTIPEAAAAIEQGMSLFKVVQVEAVDVRLLRYAEQFWQSLRATLKTFAWPILAFIVYASTRRIVFALVGAAILIATLIWGGHWLGGWNAKESFDEPIALFAMLIMALILSIPLACKDHKRAGLILGLVLLPYSVAMGTGNMLFTQVIVSLAPWGVLIAALMMTSPRDAWNPLPAVPTRNLLHCDRVEPDSHERPPPLSTCHTALQARHSLCLRNSWRGKGGFANTQVLARLAGGEKRMRHPAGRGIRRSI